MRNVITIFTFSFIIVSCSEQGPKSAINTKEPIIVNAIYDSAETMHITGGLDTLRFKKYTVIFEPSLVDSLTTYITENERDSIMRNFTNSHEAAIAFEKHIRSTYAHIFSSNDSTLTLNLANDKIKLLKWMGEEMGGNNFDYYFPGADYILLYNQYYEGNGFTLVNRKNGFKITTGGRAYFSPGNKKVLTANVDLEAHYSFNGIEYLELHHDSMVKRFEISIDEWGPEKIMWTSDSTAIIEKTFWTYGSDSMTYHSEYLKMTIRKNQ